MRFAIFALRIAAAGALVLSAVAGAGAAGPAPTIAVPAPGGGGGLVGCYRVTHTIYGPYQMGFCLNRKGGTYTVTGGGLNCNGGLDWYDTNNGRVEIDLYRARCGSGTDWTGDSLSCRIDGWRPVVQGIIGSVAGQLGVPAPSVPVGGFNKLLCTYRPAAGGYAPTSVTAKRI